MNNKTNKIIVTTVFIVAILSFIGIYKCPMNYFFGIPCITCGVTRALISALTLNFKNAFYYHALWPLVIISITMYILINLNIIKIKEKDIKILLSILILSFIIYYIIRQFIGSPVVEINFKNSLLYKIYLLIK